VGLSEECSETAAATALEKARMSLSRKNPRRDANEPAIVQALEAVGAEVWRLSGTGIPDLLVWHVRCGVLLMEVKTKSGTLTDAQVQANRRLPVHVVRTVDEALALVNHG
jgi:ribosomal protein L16/L10AE